MRPPSGQHSLNRQRGQRPRPLPALAASPQPSEMSGEEAAVDGKMGSDDAGDTARDQKRQCQWRGNHNAALIVNHSRFAPGLRSIRTTILNWRPPLPSARRGPRRRRSSTPGCSSRTRNHPQPASVLPESAAQKVSALLWRAHIPDSPPGHLRGIGPESATWKDLIPGDGAAGDQGAQNRPACPAMAATRRLRPVPSQRLPGALWSQAHMPSCNRQVTSTSIHMAKPGPASVPRGHAPL